MKYVLFLLLCMLSCNLYATSAGRLTVKNNTASSVFIADIGRNIAASSTEEISPLNYLLWAASVDIDTLIMNNTLDIYRDNALLSNNRAREIVHSLRLLIARSQGVPITGDVIEIDTDTLSIVQNGANKIKINANPITGGSSGFVSFFYDGGAENKWLRQENNHTEKSGPGSSGKRMPFILPYAGRITALTFINKQEPNDPVNADIEIYKNYVLITTWQIRGKKWASKTNGLTSLTFWAGDNISVYLKKVSGADKPEDPLVNVFYTFTGTVEQELGGTNP